MRLTPGQRSIHIHPSIGFEVELNLDGSIRFDAPDIKLNVSCPSFSLPKGKLLHGKGLHLLRADDGDIGLSFDKKSSRHSLRFAV